MITFLPETRMCPTCGERSRIITRGDSDGTIVSACCEAVIPDLNDAPTALVEDGKLVCPFGDCGAADDIVELDVATRSNEMTITEPGVISVSLGDGYFEGDGFECQQCTRRVSLPDGYELNYP
ncbi:hypothetical protein [Nonomuraea sediminis]|uniref:hypothetical protein n=1 Tax=Nonomuraea sediminis TaxID=2835864 RepID=UPI001BDC1787|nr:hypothetical protein [Nonomuraea sediminis]